MAPAVRKLHNGNNDVGFAITISFHPYINQDYGLPRLQFQIQNLRFNMFSIQIQVSNFGFRAAYIRLCLVPLAKEKQESKCIDSTDKRDDYLED